MMANMVNICKCNGEGGEELGTPSCTGKEDGNYCYPHHSNKIIQCSGGNMFVLTCQEGLEYNCPKDRCDYRDTPGNCRGHVMTQCRHEPNCAAAAE
ncbi:hypothetical protein B4U80_12487 [Leptotrombidium deliense]|uniref:Chitin-binding type-2 domain-containing protein n=1 Tax=Leptotrombidium deliense TaxID=299467 RepID=A0A443RTC8_9ACAR|nr:hypothetical protein B4U80_12487 [Leptotrombidium deliense]